MMIIVGVFKQTGVFEYLAIWAARRSGGRPFRRMVLLVVITAVGSALLDNVTTVLLVAPVTFAVCARLGLPAVPYLIAQVFASNIGGTATLIGDPPNIIIASAAMAPIVEDLVAAAPDPAQAQPLWWAFALGADLGGNTTAVAAGANVVVIGIAARQRQPIGFWLFTKYGLIVTTVTLVLAWAYVWFRDYAFV
jgi:Na+/H+ antiporter NhaD/arsenite permease-like protein